MIVGVHGFGYAPGSIHNDPSSLFADWAKMLECNIQGFSYFSYPVGLSIESLKAYWQAVKRGYYQKYVAAFKEAAPEAAANLTYKLQSEWAGSSNIVAHSLGGRVANLMLKQLKVTKAVKRILILEGAELQGNVIDRLPPGIEVLNICSRSDRVLEDLGSVFSGEGVAGCIGRDGLGRKMDRWYDICLDDPLTQERVRKARGWNLDGSSHCSIFNIVNEVRDFGGHWRAYCDLDNAPLYRAFLTGDPLRDVLPR